MSVARETLPEPTAIGVARETPAPGHGSEHARRHVSLLARLLLVPLRGYRRFLSPALTPRCRYHPSCSAYAEESIIELGAFRGAILAAWRLLRCNPFSKGGLDPLSERRLFRSSESTEGTETA